MIIWFLWCCNPHVIGFFSLIICSMFWWFGCFLFFSFTQKQRVTLWWKNWWQVLLDWLCFPFSCSFGNPLGVPQDDSPSWPWWEGMEFNFTVSLLDSWCAPDPFLFPNVQESDNVVIPTSVPLSSEHISDEGVYLLENGEECLIYVGNSVRPNILQNLFGISSIEDISSQVVLTSTLIIFPMFCCSPCYIFYCTD